jgi:hypothetical protein
MTFKAKLNKDQLFRLTILRHIEKPSFYFNAFTSAIFIAYAIWQDIYLILFIAWIPFVLYMALGATDAFRSSRDKDNVLLLPTQYTFNDDGITLKTSLAEGHLQWEHIAKMKTVMDCYIFYLENGQMVAIPQEAIPANHKAEFQQIVRQNMTKKS